MKINNNIYAKNKNMNIIRWFMHSVSPYKPTCTRLPAESVANQFVGPRVDAPLVTSYGLAA
jgi:hypothetical protein